MDFISLQSTCRTCSASEAVEVDDKQIFIPLFKGTLSCKIAHAQVLEEVIFFNLGMWEDDGLPQQICRKCLEAFKTVSIFRKRCERVQDILGAYFKGSVLQSTQEVIEAATTYNEQEGDFIFQHTNPIDKTCGNESIEDAQNESCGPLSDNDIDQYAEVEYVVELQKDNDDQSTYGNIHSYFSQNFNCDARDELHLPSSEPHTDESMQKNTFDENEICTPLETKQYTCPYCSNSYQNTNHLSNHIIKCPNNTTCRHCNCEFESVDMLEQHVKKCHPNGGPHRCSFCDQVFQRLQKLNYHIQIHNEPNTYNCEICSQGFRSKIYLYRHKKRVHETGDHECSRCFKKFNSTQRFQYHMKTHDSKKKYQCNFCDKSFLQLHHWKNHELMHTGQRPFLCTICGKDFKLKGSFRDHMRLHNGEPRHVCNICGSELPGLKSLRAHVRKHNIDQPMCEICGEKFEEKEDLTIHLLSHI